MKPSVPLGTMIVEISALPDSVSPVRAVTALLRQIGHGDVIDLGGIETARGPEMFLPLWIRINLALDGNDFGIKVVRGPSLRGAPDRGLREVSDR